MIMCFQWCLYLHTLGYRPLKSFLIPLNVLVLSPSNRILLLLLTKGLFKYDIIVNFSYFTFCIFECSCCIFCKNLNAEFDIFSLIIALNFCFVNFDISVSLISSWMFLTANQPQLSSVRGVFH